MKLLKRQNRHKFLAQHVLRYDTIQSKDMEIRDGYPPGAWSWPFLVASSFVEIRRTTTPQDLEGAVKPHMEKMHFVRQPKPHRALGAPASHSCGVLQVTESLQVPELAWQSSDRGGEHQKHPDTPSAVCPVSHRVSSLLPRFLSNAWRCLLYCLMPCICIHPIYNSCHLTASIIGQLVSEMLIYRSADDIMCVCTCERQP